MAEESGGPNDGVRPEVERQQITEQDHRVEALTALGIYGIGKALFYQDPVSLTDEELKNREILAPHAYAIPLSVDEQTQQETSHLVLCNDGRMAVVKRPEDEGERNRYDQYFALYPEKPKKTDAPEKPDRFFRAAGRENISQLLALFGREEDQNGGFITKENTSSFDAPAFRRYIGESFLLAVPRANNRAQLTGADQLNPGMAKNLHQKVLDSFLQNGPYTPPASDSPPRHQK